MRPKIRRFRTKMTPLFDPMDWEDEEEVQSTVTGADSQITSSLGAETDNAPNYQPYTLVGCARAASSQYPAVGFRYPCLPCNLLRVRASFQ
jgi:hypothetical protein